VETIPETRAPRALDLRFTKIQYLPRASEAEPQRFNYTTRIGFGLQIVGQGESTGNREEATGLRTSALKFWSADSKSLIEEGSGYWQYIPTENGVRFLTWYDYRTRFGAMGRLLDTVLFGRCLGGLPPGVSTGYASRLIEARPKVALRCQLFTHVRVWQSQSSGCGRGFCRNCYLTMRTTGNDGRIAPIHSAGPDDRPH